MTPPGYVDVTSQAILNDYLNNGGNLYIESTNIGIDHIGTEFIDLLGVKFLNDGIDFEVHSVTGGNTYYEPGMFFDYQGGISPHYSVDQLLSDGASLLFQSEDEKGRIFLSDEGTYKAVTSSVVIGAIASGDTFNIKPYLLSEMVNHFMGYNPSTGSGESISAILNTGNYPEPFRFTTDIEYYIQREGHVDITVYNLSGQAIKVIENSVKTTGNHKVSWDGNDDHGNPVKSGYYFARIQTGGESSTEKMLLVR